MIAAMFLAGILFLVSGTGPALSAELKIFGSRAPSPHQQAAHGLIKLLQSPAAAAMMKVNGLEPTQAL
jgi:hypothetical protein